MTITINDKRVPNVLAIPLAQGDHLKGQLDEVASRTGTEADMLANDFKGAKGEVLLVYAQSNPGKKIYLIGVGKKLDHLAIFESLRTFIFSYKSKLPAKLGLDLRHIAAEQLEPIVEYASEAMLQGLYKTHSPKSDKDAVFGGEKSKIQIVVEIKHVLSTEARLNKGQVFAEVRKEIMDLVNRPSNLKTPLQMADFAKKMGKKSGFTVKVLDNKALQREGLHAIRCIGMGSENPPALILLEYKPNGVPLRDKKVVGLVGKGITFDTGGISIKPSDNMGYMKSDMGGAAAVLGTFMAVAQLNLPVRLVGAIPVAENMPSGKAVKPGDITESYSGKTIEIIDTDAEGRVVLADGLAYLIKNSKPDILIDLATLTGSIVRSLGYYAGGLFSNNTALVNALHSAGEQTGDRVWQMPLYEEYEESLKSDVADVKNFAALPPGGAIWAAKFLEVFTENHPAWAHLDIAGVAFGKTIFGKGKTGTAYGVRLLTEFLENGDLNRVAEGK